MGNCQKQQQLNQNTTGDHLGPVSQIRLTNYAWNQDYQGLFDYDSNEVEKKMLKVQGNAILLKIQKKYELVDQNVDKLTQDQLRTCQFRLLRKDDYYLVEPIFIQSENINITVQKLLWLVLSSLPNKYHQIRQKDIIKLGKQKIRVRQIAHSDTNPSNLNQPIKLSKTVYQNLTYQPPDKQPIKQQKPIQSSAISEKTNNEQVCRICLDPGQFDNPLITPCKCSGSVKYIHLNCLRAWLAKRLHVVKSQHCITINWLPLSCEMCKTGYKYRIYMDNRKFYTVDIPKPPKPYIILQLMKKSSGSVGKIFHFVSFANKNKILLGRRKDIDVRISEDISISRAHACIEYLPEQKQFTICDNKSKFGTLLLIKKGLLVRPKYRNISFQIGAEVYSFDAIRGSSKQNFILNQGENDEYLADNLSQQDQEQQENQDELDSDEQEQNVENVNNSSSMLGPRLTRASVQPEV